MESLDAGYAVSLTDVGRNYVRHPRRPEKKKAAPIMTEERALRVWDTISPKDQERIRAEAKEYAAEAMAAFQTRRGR